MKTLQQNKEDLEKCIKEQGPINDVSVPKTDDLVDEVNNKSMVLLDSQISALQEENSALRTKVEVMQDEIKKKVTKVCFFLTFS